MKQLVTILFFLFLLPCYSLFAQEEEDKPAWLLFRGYVKDMVTFTFVNPLDSVTTGNLIHNRLNFKFNISRKFSGRLEIRNRVYFGEQVSQTPEFGTIINQYNGVLNVSKLWVNEKSLVVQSVVDRVLLQYENDQWNIIIGRQRINWGINTIWNPNDIFNAYNFLDFDYEERPGNDAIRVKHHFLNNSTVDVAFTPGDSSDKTIAAVLYMFNKRNYDLQLLGGIYQADIVAGGGWAGNIKNAGFKGEASYFHPKENILDTSGTVSLSVMAEQTFKNDWYFSLSALYNSNPSGIYTGSGTIYSPSLSAKELTPYKFTFAAWVMKSISPIISLNCAVIYSPENNTLILFPAIAWNAARNFDLDLTVQSYFASEMNTYKAQGTGVYLRGKFSF